MQGRAAEIERLIEAGLDCYGSGDLDAALEAWEKALAIDPKHPLANSYVDYLRANYDRIVAGDVTADESVGFALHEEPEYHIEIVVGEMPAPASAFTLDAVDEGWGIGDDESQLAETIAQANRDAVEPVDAGDPVDAYEATDPGEPPGITVEIEADEPPDDAIGEEATLARVDRGEAYDEPPQGLSFEDATTEYRGSRANGSATDFHAEPPTTEFQHEGTPVGFSDKTQVKKRDFGFVQPTAPTAPIDPAPPILPDDIRKRPTQQSIPPPPAKPVPLRGAAASVAIGQAPTMELSSALSEETQTIRQVADATIRQPAEAARSDTRELPSNFQTPLISAPTRDLGLRPTTKPPDDDEDAPTRESDARAIRDYMSDRAPAVPVRDLADERSARMLAAVETGPAGEADDDRTRRKITALFDKASACNQAGDTEQAVLAVDLALDVDASSALAQKLVHRNRELALAVFQAYLGDMQRQPRLMKPLHELSGDALSPRAAFLLSRIDGTLTLDEILDVSGMPRLEAYRYLCQLFLRDILK